MPLMMNCPNCTQAHIRHQRRRRLLVEDSEDDEDEDEGQKVYSHSAPSKIRLKAVCCVTKPKQGLQARSNDTFNSNLSIGINPKIDDSVKQLPRSPVSVEAFACDNSKPKVAAASGTPLTDERKSRPVSSIKFVSSPVEKLVLLSPSHLLSATPQRSASHASRKKCSPASTMSSLTSQSQSSRLPRLIRESRESEVANNTALEHGEVKGEACEFGAGLTRSAQYPVVSQKISPEPQHKLRGFTLVSYMEHLWALAHAEDAEEAPLRFPRQMIELGDVASQLNLHRYGKYVWQHTFKGIKIRLTQSHWKNSLTASSQATKVPLKIGVNEETRWITMCWAQVPATHSVELRLRQRYGRINLVKVKAGSKSGFLPQYKPSDVFEEEKAKGGKLLDKEGDSSDEEAMSKGAAEQLRAWKRDNQMLYWIEVFKAGAAGSKRKPWWAITRTSLDCDGFNDRYGVPAALGFDLHRIENKINGVLGGQDAAGNAGIDDQRSMAYSESAGNDRWRALKAADIQFYYPEYNEGTKTDGAESTNTSENVAPLSTASPQQYVSPGEVDSTVIPRKKRKLATPCVDSSAISSAGPPSSVSSDGNPMLSPVSARRLKQMRSETHTLETISEAAADTAESTSAASSAVLSRECHVVARGNNGHLFTESFRELPSDIVGRGLWWIFALGLPTVTEHLLAYNGPTLLWNLLRLRRPWGGVITEMLEDYRGRACEDRNLNSQIVIRRINDFLDDLKRYPELRHRRLATLRFREELRHPKARLQKEKSLFDQRVSMIGPLRDGILQNTAAKRKRHKILCKHDLSDEPDYDRKICDIVATRVILYYSKLRYHRQFAETRINLCKCHRCRLKFKQDIAVGDGRLVKDIESNQDLPQETATALLDSPIDTESAESSDLMVELRALTLDKSDDIVDVSRTIRTHSERTMQALAALAKQCSGDQCSLSEHVRFQLHNIISAWTGLPAEQERDTRDTRRPKRDRAGHVAEGDIEELRKSYLDGDAFPMRSAHKLSFQNRKLLYKLCADRDWIAAMLIARNEKGRAVYAASVIYKGDFVCEYKGVFYHQYGLARAKENDYTLMRKGSFMFYFRNPLTGTTCCIDSTAEDSHFGPARLINHSHRQPNLEAMVVGPVDDWSSVAMSGTKINEKDRRSRLIFFACRDIRIGEELLIDYGETNRRALELNDWLYD